MISNCLPCHKVCLLVGSLNLNGIFPQLFPRARDTQSRPLFSSLRLSVHGGRQFSPFFRLAVRLSE